jgi:centromeric protein E
MLTGDHLIDDQIKGPNREVKLKESMKRGTFISGATSARISNAEEIVQLLNLGELNRHVNSTN